MDSYSIYIEHRAIEAGSDTGGFRMQTLLAYAFDEGARAAEEAVAGLKRVAEHYDPLWPGSGVAARTWRRSYRRVRL